MNCPSTSSAVEMHLCNLPYLSSVPQSSNLLQSHRVWVTEIYIGDSVCEATNPWVPAGSVASAPACQSDTTGCLDFVLGEVQV